MPQTHVIDLCSASSEEDVEHLSKKITERSSVITDLSKDRPSTGGNRKRARPADQEDEVDCLVSMRHPKASMKSHDGGRAKPKISHPGELVVLEEIKSSKDFCHSSLPMTKQQNPFVAVYIEGDGDTAIVTDGIVNNLRAYCHTMANTSSQNKRFLASCCRSSGDHPGADRLSCLCHIQQKDKFSCGYRNTQMLLAALCNWLSPDHPYFALSNQHVREASPSGLFAIPSLQTLQRMMESGWAIGLDPEGAAHFSGSIVGKTSWIGAAEVWSLFAYWKMDACLVQFIKCHESRRLLGFFCAAYCSPRFSSACLHCSRGRIKSRSFVEQLLKCAEQTRLERVVQSKKSSNIPAKSSCSCLILPLYLQWQGHSVTVVGVESDSKGLPRNLIVLDPLAEGNQYKQDWSRRYPPKARVPLAKVERKDCQLIVVSPFAANHRQINAVTAASEAVQRVIYGANKNGKI